MRILIAVVAGVLAVATVESTSGATPVTGSVRLTDKACAAGAARADQLIVSAAASAFSVDTTGLKLSQRPKELMLMRKPAMTFFRIPWVVGKTSHDVSAATAKPVFGQEGLFPLQQGEKLSLSVMSSEDEVLVSCDVWVR